MTEEKTGQLTSLEVMARLTGTKIKFREVVTKFLLLTYDLPNTDAGNKARSGFLAQAKSYGATKHTESVYLMPHTKQAEMLALELAKVGDVEIWYSTIEDPVRAEEVTKSYDEGLQPMLDEVSERLDKVAGHFKVDHNQRAINMLNKTAAKLDAIEQAIIRRGSAQLYLIVLALRLRFKSLGG